MMASRSRSGLKPSKLGPKTVVASALFVTLALGPAYLIEHAFGVRIAAVAAVGLFLLAVPVAIGVMTLIVFCCDREVELDGERVDVARPYWQPAVILGVAVPLLVRLGDWLSFADTAYLAWVGLVLGGSAGLANHLLRDRNLESHA